MEINRSIRASILPSMWTTSLDLSDAYFHIPICHSYRRYLRFVWNNRVYQFRALPFRLSTAPLVFTKDMQTAIAHLHSQAIQIHSYLDKKIRPQDFLGENSLTQQGLVSESLFESSSVSVSENSYCSPIFTTARSFEFSSGRCSTWSPSHSTTSILSTPALAPSSSELGLSNSDYSSGLVSSSSMVDCSRERFESPTSVLPSPKSDFVHGFLQSRLGNLSGRSFSLGSMDSRSSEGAHQFPRNEGSSSCTVSFPVPSAEQVSCSCIGQHHSCCIFEESRRNSLLQTTF